MADWNLIVIGGGPAGMMAAIRAAERSRRVLLLERGPSLGRKLLLTGGGRCNLTNTAPLEGFVRAFGRGGGFLRRALGAFGPEDLQGWLRERRLEAVEEEGGRVFPTSGGAPAVLAVLTRALGRSGCEVRLRQHVVSLVVEQGRAAGCRAREAEWRAEGVLVTTGGLSYPATGSTGDGYGLARQAGHSLTPCYAAIVALETADDWPRSLPGVAVQGARVRAVACDSAGRERALAAADGDVLCTHSGLSGPAVLAVSTEAVRALGRGQTVFLEVHLVPGVAEEELLADFAGTRRSVRSVLAGRVPRRLAGVIAGLAGVDPALPAEACPKQQRLALVGLLRRLRVRVAGARPVAEAVVTGGGVPLKEVDDRTMESRLLPGLRFAGEVLDVQGPPGGYNLQAAFSTGYLAGESA